MCFGFNTHYEDTRRIYGIKTLQERRELAVEKFARKAMNNPRFCHQWFRPREAIETDLRRRRPFIETKARTTRYKNSPLLNLQRVANNIMTAGA